MLPRDLGRHRQGSVVSVAWGIRAPHPQSLGSGENAGIPGAGRARFGILCGLELESRRGPRQAVVGFSDPVSRLDFNFGFHFDRLGHGLSETCDRGRPTGHDSQLSFHTEASLNADRRSWLDGLLVDATAHSAVGGGGEGRPAGCDPIGRARVGASRECQAVRSATSIKLRFACRADVQRGGDPGQFGVFGDRLSLACSSHNRVPYLVGSVVYQR